MALGRIKRSRSKVQRMLRANTRTMHVAVQVYRHAGRGGNYAALACVRSKVTSTGIRTRKSCSRTKIGRTPQSAIAKALKSLSSTVARRGR